MSSSKPAENAAIDGGGRVGVAGRGGGEMVKQWLGSGFALRSALAVGAGLALGLPFANSSLYFLSWFALVPLLWAVEGRGLAYSYYLGILAGVACWAAGTYWLPGFVVTIKGYAPPWNTVVALVFWLYVAQLYGAILLLYQWLRRSTGLPAVLVFPVVFVALHSVFPMVFDIRFGESQSAFVVAMQGVDITGTLGLDAMICLSNALLFMLLCRQWRGAQGIAVACSVLVLVAWFAYGHQRLQYWDATVAEWPTRQIGIVQPNDEPTIDIPPPPEGFTRRRPPELMITEKLAERGAELVVWPETRYKGYFASAQVRVAYRKQLEAAGTALLFHDLERVTHDNGYDDYNTAVLINSEGEQVGFYRKVKRMAFGEYVPVLSEVPFVRRMVEGYFGDFLREITPGEGVKTLEADGFRLVPKVCYESAFPAFIAENIGADAAGKLIVVMSNDVWFGETSQPVEHLHSSVLRAVENRVPLVHAINGGPSGAVLPSGRFALHGEAYTKDAYLVDLPYSSEAGGSFYARNPWVFLYSVYAVGVILVVMGIGRRRRQSKRAA